MQSKFRRLTTLTIALYVLGCSQFEDDYDQDPSVRDIRPIMSVGGTLYFLDNNKWTVYRFNDKTKSWEWIDAPGYASSLAADQTTLYIGTGEGIYRVAPGSNIATPVSPSRLEWLNPSTEAFAVEGENIYAAATANKLFHSPDGSKSWDEINVSGYADESILNVLISGKTVYVVVERQGVYRSDDGGKKWTAINQGLPDISHGWRPPLLLFHKNALYIVLPTGVYRRYDGETTWMRTALNAWGVTSLVASRTALYVGGRTCGVFRSPDGGNSWHYVGLAGREVTALGIHDNRLYAGTWDEGIFYTNEGAKTWHPLNKGLVIVHYDDEGNPITKK